MSQALTRYNVMHESLRSRRRRPEFSRGLDAIATRLLVRNDARQHTVAHLRTEAEAIDLLAPSMHAMSEAALNDAVMTVREMFVRQRQDNETLHRGFALVREVARRQTGEEAYIVQLMAALAMSRGRVVEMVTGEGKTLTGSIAAVLIAWQRRHLHILTVNDYLARRDAESRKPIYARCGLHVGAIQQEQPPEERFELYARSIIYGTPKQITADWLRDQIRLRRIDSAWSGRSLMARSPMGQHAGPMVPGLRAALVDEADAVLIDEGVVPLIIAQSRQGDSMSSVYRVASQIAAQLDEGPDYTIEHVRRRAELRKRGEERCDEMFSRAGEPIFRARRRGQELVRQALVARHCYRRGDQYQIVDGCVVIVDEYTGRFLADRSWEHGLHQAVEAKEDVEITADRETMARMSFQRFFRSYPFLAGMTGTAADATGEIEHVYRRPVVVVPTNKPLIRKQLPMRIFTDAKSKWNAIVESIEQVSASGRPVLVGTRSIEASEHVSHLLEDRGMGHRVLNAHHDEEEAELIVLAGRAGGREGPAITVATNMAGRGTDIKLDDAARSAGGLHVMLTEMHTAQRIDRQFIGRAGRQGDPGSAQIFVSFDDDLMRLYASRIAKRLRSRMTTDEITQDSSLWKLAARAWRLAQWRAEARSRRNRAGVLRQDDWIEKHLPGG